MATRLESLDVFRGLVIAAMILVTDPGTYAAVYAPLAHSEWEHPTATDVISPAFLLIVGVSMALSYAAALAKGSTSSELAWKTVRRAGLLFVVGLALNAFPWWHLATLRYTGILQRIAVCSLIAGLVYVGVRARYRAIALALLCVGVLAAYWALLRWYPVPGFGPGHLDSLGSLPSYLDRTWIPAAHIWPWGLTPGHGVTYDADGILSTLGSLPNLLAGVLVGQVLLLPWTTRKKVLALLGAGVALTLVGCGMGLNMAMIKRIWTPSFAVWSAGVSVLLLAGMYWLLDVVTASWLRRVAGPMRVFGTNALLAFAFSTILTAYLSALHMGHVTVRVWLYNHAFATWLQPFNASLAYALLVVVVNFALVYPFYRRGLFLRL